MDELVERVEEHIRRHDLIAPGGAVTCLVSGGADSTCLHHVLTRLGYDVSALHVDHGLRGAESDADADWCAERLGKAKRPRMFTIVDELPRTSVGKVRKFLLADAAAAALTQEVLS